MTIDSRTWYLVRAIDKLDEAAFFFEQVRREPQGSGVSFYVNAFAGATWSVWECITQLCRPAPVRSNECPTCGHSRPEYPEDDTAWNWFLKTKANAMQSPVAKYFHKGRSADVHGGEGFVEGYAISVRVVDGDVQSETKPLLRDSDGSGFPDGRPPIEACETYLASLVRILAQAYGEFRSEWDATGDLDKDVQRLRKLWGGSPQ